MKTTALFFTVLALVAAAFGFWALAGLAAWLIRILALIFLIFAVLALRRKASSP